MPLDFIKIDTLTTTAVFAGELRTLVSQLRITVNQLDRLKAIMDHNQDGTNFGAIEALFGLPVGKGQVVYDFVNGTRGSLGGVFQTDDALKFIAQVG